VTTQVQKGLHLPRLTTTQRDAMIPATVADSAAAVGLAVFNTDSKCYDVWNGKQWLSLCRGNSNTLAITGQPAPFTFRRLVDVNGDPNGPAAADAVTLSVTATGTGTLTYAWYEQSKNRNSTVRGTVLATTATFSPAVTAWGMRSYYCVVKNGTDSVVFNVADVAVGCGAKTTDGGWIGFMCQNLGAAPAPAGSLDGITFANDTTSSDAKGWLFQWGRVADGHQWRSSPTVAGPYSSTTNTQVPAGDPAYGHFIINNDMATFYDWRTPQYDVNWRHVDDMSNVCPSGWHVPTADDWGNIYRSGATWGSPSLSSANDWVWVTNGFAIRPDGRTTTLFLPAAGARYGGTGTFAAVGTYGDYWTSTTVSSFAYYMVFARTKVLPLLQTNRAYGHSLRCSLIQY